MRIFHDTAGGSEKCSTAFYAGLSSISTHEGNRTPSPSLRRARSVLQRGQILLVLVAVVLVAVAVAALTGFTAISLGSSIQPFFRRAAVRKRQKSCIISGVILTRRRKTPGIGVGSRTVSCNHFICERYRELSTTRENVARESGREEVSNEESNEESVFVVHRVPPRGFEPQLSGFVDLHPSLGRRHKVRVKDAPLPNPPVLFRSHGVGLYRWLIGPTGCHPA